MDQLSKMVPPSEPVPTMVEVDSTHLLSKDDWYEVCCRVKPHLTWAEFEELWNEFQDYKRWKKLQ